jgi:hypothetical protein
MTKARIVVDAATLTPGSIGPATGTVWLDVEGVAFPSEKWNDFVVVVLGWWAAAVLRALRGEIGPHEVHFMDGPYLVELTAASRSDWRLALIDTGETRRLRRQYSVTPRQLVESIIIGSDSILRASRAAGHWSTDATKLEEATAGLRNELK